MIKKNTYDNKIYWNQYYKSKKIDLPNSDFSKFVLKNIRPKSSLVDIGCGDGRDTKYFAKNDIFATGVDYSSVVIKKNKQYTNSNLNFKKIDLNNLNSYKNYFDYGYCRFIFHAINHDLEAVLLNWLKNNIKYKTFIETRIFDSKNEIINQNHYRRSFTEKYFEEVLVNNNFKIIYFETSYKFSKYKKIYEVKDLNTDPLVLRAIIQ